MKVFTFFYNRFTDATTSIALKECGIPHYVMMHTQQDADRFRKHDTARGQVVVTGNRKGLAYQRNAALDMMNAGEWAAFMCDDFRHVMMYPPKLILSKTHQIEDLDIGNQNAFRITKGKSARSLADLFSVVPKLLEVADANGIHLVGFGYNTNPQSLKNKFSMRGLADGRFWLVKKSYYGFDERVQLIDDVAWTAENLIRHNNVLVLNWAIPEFARYTGGGFGTIQERLPQRRAEVEYLCAKYHPVVRTSPKPGWPSGTHVKLYGSDANLQLARKKLL